MESRSPNQTKGEHGYKESNCRACVVLGLGTLEEKMSAWRNRNSDWEHTGWDTVREDGECDSVLS